MTSLPSRRKNRQDDRTDQLEAQVRSLQEQLVCAQRLATMGTMSAMVAHEFNNILTPIYNYARLAAGGDEKMRDKAIRHALEGSTRAAAICRALLDLTRTEAQTPRKVSLAELLNETLAAMARDFSKDGIRLVTKVPSRLTVTTRPAELKQVLLNLLLNARAAVMDKGRGQSISISADRSNGSVILRVADTGVGIPPEIKKRIFEPFFTTRNGTGSGLGLAVCRQIIRSMKGRLTVRSQQGKGTVFTVSLPSKPGVAKAAQSHRITRKPVTQIA
ncbi:MAG: HAMP domain-containing sensor histidine kinase [Planctomycetota bacterium]|nr:HAMP domain-containing sensor histidine kinase [Planctomycetota bacterium]